MVSKELKDSLTILQAAALEKIARRDGIATSRAQLQHMIERAGIVGAYTELRRLPPRRPEPQVSIFRRFTQRWFGRN
jgi:hypothetical protein